MRSYTVILSGREESRIISEQFSTQIKSEMFRFAQHDTAS